MDQQITPTTSYKEVKIGKTIYRVTSFFRAKGSWERLWSSWLSGAPCQRIPHLPAAPHTRLHSHTILPALPHPCAAMDSPLRCSYREIPCGAITPHEVWNLDNREGK